MKILFYLMVVILLITGGMWVAQHPYFQISTIEIVGENDSGSLKHISKQEVFEAVKPHLTGSFFYVNLRSAQKVVEQMPWVRHVKIDRIPPSMIKIRLSEYEPAARWLRQGVQAGLVTREGEIFQASYDGQLPEFDGDVNEQKKMLEQYDVFSSYIKPLRLGILRLQYTPRASWNMMLDNGIEVRLGTDNIHARMARFVKYYPSQLSQHAQNLDYIDMRYPNAFATRLREDAPNSKILEQK